MKMGKGAMHQHPEEFKHGHLESKNRERAIKNAHYAKVDATDSWVKGHISSKEHSAVHGPANEIIKTGAFSTHDPHEHTEPKRQKTFAGKGAKEDRGVSKHLKNPNEGRIRR